ncbi:MAG: restriction endonuclease subunit S [Gemmatimonadales bacterium]|nr:restriction endonuclease subunit S [Gemmatimonadales bacterium]
MGKSAAQVTTIGACAAVLPGYSMGSAMKHDPEGTHQVILSRHLTLGQAYAYEPLDEFRLTPGGRDATRYEVKPGDLLFMSRGTRNLAWEIGRVPEPSLAPVSFYIVRPGPGVTPGYLAWYLNHPRTQAAIGQIRTGAGTPIVQRAAFTELPMTLPPPEVQRTIAALDGLVAAERKLLAHRVDATTRLNQYRNELILQNLAGGESKDHG